MLICILQSSSLQLFRGADDQPAFIDHRDQRLYFGSPPIQTRVERDQTRLTEKGIFRLRSCPGQVLLGSVRFGHVLAWSDAWSNE
jgi:hypothetical protein